MICMDFSDNQDPESILKVDRDTAVPSKSTTGHHQSQMGQTNHIGKCESIVCGAWPLVVDLNVVHKHNYFPHGIPSGNQT